MFHPTLTRLRSFENCEPGDLEGLALLTGPRRAIARGTILRFEGDTAPDVYLLVSGWLICSVNTSGGNRQITKVHLPGDLVGMPSLASLAAMETIEAVADAVVEAVPLSAFGLVFKNHPKLAAMLFLWAQEERVRLMHQLTIVGRHQGVRRIAAFLLALYQRVQMNASPGTLTFDFPLTQRELADATGLTAVHVNRCLKLLRDRGILTIFGGRLSIHRLDDLESLAGMPLVPRRRLDWL